MWHSYLKSYKWKEPSKDEKQNQTRSYKDS